MLKLHGKPVLRHRILAFWTFVERVGDCLIWTGGRRSGYGVFKVNGKNVLSHRFAYMATNGPIPEGKLCCHTCDTPLCCNPDHLFLGTHGDNSRDAARKGRWRA